MSKGKPGPGRPLGSKNREVSDKRRAAQSRNGSAVRGTRYDEDAKACIGDARSRGAKALPLVIDDVIRVATLGYSRFVDPHTGEEMFERVEPETKLHAARFIGDRCGFPPRAETEISSAEAMPLTVIVMGTEGE